LVIALQVLPLLRWVAPVYFTEASNLILSAVLSLARASHSPNVHRFLFCVVEQIGEAVSKNSVRANRRMPDEQGIILYPGKGNCGQKAPIGGSAPGEPELFVPLWFRIHRTNGKVFGFDQIFRNGEIIQSPMTETHIPELKNRSLHCLKASLHFDRDCWLFAGIRLARHEPVGIFASSRRFRRFD